MAESAAATHEEAKGGEAYALPALGFGTMEYVDGSHKTEEMHDVTLAALKAGFRLIDTAEMYESVPHVGKAIAASGVPREELHIVSKLSGLPSGDYAAVRARLQAHLKALAVDAVDTLLMHWPGKTSAASEGKEAVDPMTSADTITAACDFGWFKANVAEAWANMAKLREAGLTKHIGVSNFYSQHLEAMRELGLELPVVDEVFIDAGHPQQKLVEYAAGKGIKLLAYRPVTFLPVVEMAGSMGDGTQALCESLKTESGAATIPQAVLAWLIARGITPLVKTSSAERLTENLAAVEVASKAGGEAAGKLTQGLEESMVDMCGGLDELAAAIESCAPAASE